MAGSDIACIILPLLRYQATMAPDSGVRLLEPHKAPIACALRLRGVFARSAACVDSMGPHSTP